MTDLVMNYTVNPIWARLKSFGKKFIEAQERVGRARAAQHLAAMGYYKEAKELMIESKASK
jgi:hypothetical protein